VIALADKVLVVDRGLTDAGIPHAFGGALALAYCIGEPRATIDIDLNVFLAPTDVSRAFAALPDAVAIDPDAVGSVEHDGQVRVWWGHTPIDLFFSYHPFHERIAARVRRVPFGAEEIPVLSCADLAVFKAVFNRGRDWVDLQAMVDADSFDSDDTVEWLRAILGDGAPQVERLVALEPDASPDPGMDRLPEGLRPRSESS
jgi:Nucleotidyl transferase AbiEii toxin, Type IV TA system